MCLFLYILVLSASAIRDIRAGISFLREELKSDFLVLGSYWYDVDGRLEYVPTLTKKEFFGYIDFTIEGMASGLYNFLAHPDLFLADVSNIDSDHLACSKALIQSAIDLDMPIEINGYGTFKRKIVRAGRDEFIYPVRQFWELASDMGQGLSVILTLISPIILFWAVGMQ